MTLAAAAGQRTQRRHAAAVDRHDRSLLGGLAHQAATCRDRVSGGHCRNDLPVVKSAVEARVDRLRRVTDGVTDGIADGAMAGQSEHVASSDDPDVALLRRHLEGDPAAFTEICRRHRDHLWAVALADDGRSRRRGRRGTRCAHLRDASRGLVSGRRESEHLAASDRGERMSRQVAAPGRASDQPPSRRRPRTQRDPRRLCRPRHRGRRACRTRDVAGRAAGRHRARRYRGLPGRRGRRDARGAVRHDQEPVRSRPGEVGPAALSSARRARPRCRSRASTPLSTAGEQPRNPTGADRVEPPMNPPREDLR